MSPRSPEIDVHISYFSLVCFSSKDSQSECSNLFNQSVRVFRSNFTLKYQMCFIVLWGLSLFENTARNELTKIHVPAFNDVWGNVKPFHLALPVIPIFFISRKFFSTKKLNVFLITGEDKEVLFFCFTWFKCLIQRMHCTHKSYAPSNMNLLLNK
jgi:hypothetical protein